MCDTTFRKVFGMFNLFLTLFFYFKISLVHKSKKAATAILQNQPRILLWSLQIYH